MVLADVVLDLLEGVEGVAAVPTHHLVNISVLRGVVRQGPDCDHPVLAVEAAESRQFYVKSFNNRISCYKLPLYKLYLLQTTSFKLNL